MAVGVREDLSASERHGAPEAAEPNHVLLVGLNAPLVRPSRPFRRREERLEKEQANCERVRATRKDTGSCGGVQKAKGCHMACAIREYLETTSIRSISTNDAARRTG